MMWTSIATNLVQVAASHILKQVSPPSNNSNGKVEISDGNYNIQGHVNNVPVDLRVVKGSSSAPGSSFTSRGGPAENRYENVQQNKLLTRSMSTTSQGCSTCTNCSNGSNNKKKQPSNKFCTVPIPQDGNFEIRIRKTEANFAKMNVSTTNRTQNTQKQNTSKQNFNKQKQQNGNQNKPNRNQGSGAKSQDDEHKRRQNKINRQPNELKFAKHYLHGENSGAPNKGQNSHNNKPKVETQTRFSSNNQSTWMYLGRLKIGTTAFDVKNYLKQKFPGYDFWVEALPLYKDAKLPCFKVRVDNGVLEDFQNLNNWPVGTTIKKYIKDFKN